MSATMPAQIAQSSPGPAAVNKSFCQAVTSLRAIICIALLLLMTACDPVFYRIDRFDDSGMALLDSLDVSEVNRLAAEHGFTRSAIPTPSDESARYLLAEYTRSLREDGWGSSMLSLTAESESGAIDLEASAFPSSVEPPFLSSAREAITASLIRHGYAQVEWPSKCHCVYCDGMSAAESGDATGGTMATGDRPNR